VGSICSKWKAVLFHAAVRILKMLGDMVWDKLRGGADKPTARNVFRLKPVPITTNGQEHGVRRFWFFDLNPIFCGELPSFLFPSISNDDCYLVLESFLQLRQNSFLILIKFGAFGVTTDQQNGPASFS